MVSIMEEIFTEVFETAEKALEKDVDNFDSPEVCMEVTEEVNNWVDDDIEIELAGARERRVTEFKDSLDSNVRYGVQNNTEDVQTEVIMDLHRRFGDRAWPKGWQ